jgi:hypothetical protein
MATRFERKKARKKQKRDQKKKQRKRESQARKREMPPVRSADSRYRQRLARQKPHPWQGEPPEDVAVFDEAALASLSSELAAEVTAVREALQQAGQSRGDEALASVSAIGRSSPVSEWRLYIRGLVSWMADDADAASLAWRRLDSQRRPGRMATAMMAALRTDLERVHAGQPAAATAAEDDSDVQWIDRCDEKMLYHAKLLRRIRFDRAAIRIAEKAVRVPDEMRKLKLGPKKIDWLKDFATEYRAFEPDLVEALEQVALRRAHAQPYSDMFEKATKAFTGPRHDRKNSLLRFFYYAQFGDDRKAETRAENSLQQYLTKDLPANQELSEPLRNALISQTYLDEAGSMIQPQGRGMMDFVFGQKEDAPGIRKHLKAAAQAYPANRGVYKTHVQWIESKLDNERLTKPQRTPLLDEQARVMQAWTKGLPGDAEPRLWLVDHLLEDEQTDAARPHVDWLAAARQDDPRVRAAPWKWELLEAMRLCRRKAWLGEVPARLNEAAARWPVWLSQAWLPYLKAAAALRAGSTDDYEQLRRQIVGASETLRDRLPDACMMLAAAQRMRVPATDLKTLRAPVDAAVKNVEKLSDNELLQSGGFFWDLQRTQFLYPSYRMHGGKFAKEMWSRLQKRPKLVLDRLDDPLVQAAVLWCSEHRYFSDGYELKLPGWFDSPAVNKHPTFAAAKLNAFTKLRAHWRYKEYSDLGPRLREAAQSESDAYYRYWFETLADNFDEIVAALSKRSGFMGSFFEGMFGGGFEDEDDDYEDDELYFDPDCDCPRCTAARTAYNARQ